MIAKSEFTDAIVTIVAILEKQVSGFSKTQLVNLLEVLNSSDDNSLPVVVLGRKGNLLFQYMDRHTEEITSEKIQEILDYEEFQNSGTIVLRERMAS